MNGARCAGESVFVTSRLLNKLSMSRRRSASGAFGAFGGGGEEGFIGTGSFFAKRPFGSLAAGWRVLVEGCGGVGLLRPVLLAGDVFFDACFETRFARPLVGGFRRAERKTRDPEPDPRGGGTMPSRMRSSW